MRRLASVVVGAIALVAVGRAHTQSGPILELEVLHPDLEEIFVQIMRGEEKRETMDERR